MIKAIILSELTETVQGDLRTAIEEYLDKHSVCMESPIELLSLQEQSNNVFKVFFSYDGFKTAARIDYIFFIAHFAKRMTDFEVLEVGL